MFPFLVFSVNLNIYLPIYKYFTYCQDLTIKIIRNFLKVLPCFSKTVNDCTTKTSEGFRNNKECNGNNTLQELLLQNETQIRTSNPEGYELIVLKATINNMSKNFEETEVF